MISLSLWPDDAAARPGPALHLRQGNRTEVVSSTGSVPLFAPAGRLADGRPGRRSPAPLDVTAPAADDARHA
jgi:hypothetical protein